MLEMNFITRFEATIYLYINKIHVSSANITLIFNIDK